MTSPHTSVSPDLLLLVLALKSPEGTTSVTLAFPEADWEERGDATSLWQLSGNHRSRPWLTGVLS